MGLVDPYTLPPDLPVPEDDGARRPPSRARDPAARAAVVAGAGRPRRAAAGGPSSTCIRAQACRACRCCRAGTSSRRPRLHAAVVRVPRPRRGARRLRRARCRALGSDARGQIEFAERNRMPFPVIADPELELRAALGLPTFEIAGLTLYKRLALIAEHGVIVKVFYPVFPPDRNAATSSTGSRRTGTRLAERNPGLRCPGEPRSRRREARRASPPTACARCGSGPRAARPRTREMTNLPARDAGAARRARCRSRRSSSRTRRTSIDGTVKALFRTRDGHPVEAVLMRYRDGRRSVCLSSQSGCPLTCTFCATGPDAVPAATSTRGRSSTRRSTSAASSRSTTSSSWAWASRC